MAETPFEFPYFPGAEEAGEWGILSEPSGFLAVRTQELADLLQRPVQDAAPFGVTAEQGRSVSVQPCPAVKIAVGNPEQLRLLTQPYGHAAAQLQADLVCQFVSHVANVAGWFAAVNACVPPGGRWPRIR